MYFLLQGGDDGTTVFAMTEEEANTLINDPDECPKEFMTLEDTRRMSGKFIDMNYAGERAVLIRGEIVVPEDVRVVTRKRLPK